MKTKIINLSKARDSKDANLYRIAQAEKMLDLFEAANDRPADDVDELEKWAASPEGNAALAQHCNANGKIVP
jgi:hypothetical protein